MNLALRTVVEWLSPLLRRLMMFGFQVESEVAAADLAEIGNAARLRAMKSSFEAIELASQLANGDEAKAEVAALFKQGTVDQVRTMQQLLNERATATVAEAALNRPFSDVTPSETSSLPSSAPEGQGPNGSGEDVTPPPVRRGPGRPRKDQNKAP